MKTIFMGNHTVGVIVLKELIKSTEVIAVFAYPDHPEDGKLYLSVKKTAREAHIPVYQFDASHQRKIPPIVAQLQPDLIVVADYKYILKKDVLEIPKLGAVNFHPSLLPKYRGRAPVNWAIINGEKECGLSVHFIGEEVDDGDIILQEKVEIAFSDTVKDIHDKLFPLYEKLAVETIKLFKSGNVPRTEQDPEQATIFGHRSPADGLIDWNKSAVEVYNFIRAITYPYPGAFSYMNGKKYSIWQSAILENPAIEGIENAEPGEVRLVRDDGVGVVTRDGVIMLTDVQDADGQQVDFKNSPFKVGSIFYIGYDDFR